MGEKALRDVVQVVTVALVVLVVAVVWVVVKADSADLVPESDNWLATDLNDLKDLVVTGVLLPNTFKWAIGSQTLVQPL